jgi:tetratricopeptide (TPR) repeat protein
MSTSNYPSIFLLQLQRSVVYIASHLQSKAYQVADHPFIDLTLHTLEFALEVPDLWSSTFRVLIEITPSIEHRGRYAEWTRYLSKGIIQAQQMGEAHDVAELQFHLGIGYLGQGRTQDASDLFEASYAFFSYIGNAERTARALNGLARTAHSTGNTQEAITFAYRALHMATPVSTIECAISYRLLGMIAFSQREWDQALTFFDQDLSIWRTQMHQRHIAFGLVNVGSVLRALGRAPEAIAIYEEAIGLFQAEDDQVNIAAAQLNLGNVYLGLKQFQAALEVYRQADWTLRAVNDAPRLAMLYNNMGMAHTGIGEWEAAEEFFGESISRWKALHNDRSRVNVMDNLGELYLKRGDIIQARSIFAEAYGLAETLGDSYLLRMVSSHLAMTQSF